MDFTTKPFPPSHHPSQLKAGDTMESLGIHIEMVMPHYIEDQKQAWDAFMCSASEEYMHRPTGELPREGRLELKHELAFPRVGVG